VYLATSWFGRRARGLAEQLRESAELGFRGVAVLPRSPLPEGAAEPPPALEPERVGAVAWDALADRLAEGEAGGRTWSTADLGPALSRLARLRARRVVVPVGAVGPEAERLRGERLLERLAHGESLRGDEAVEELLQQPAAAAEEDLQELAAFLHALLRAAPGLEVALHPGASPVSLLDPDRFALLLGVLGRPSALGLWWDCADAERRAALGLPPPGEWLDRFGGRIQGVALCDWAPGAGVVPPGAGTADWALLREYLPRTAVRVVALPPSHPSEWVTQAAAVLEPPRAAPGTPR